MDAVQGSARNTKRRTVVSVYADNASAHHGERFHDSAHWAFLNGGVACERAFEGLPGEDTADQSRGGAAVAHIQNGRGSL